MHSRWRQNSDEEPAQDKTEAGECGTKQLQCSIKPAKLPMKRHYSYADDINLIKRQKPAPVLKVPKPMGVRFISVLVSVVAYKLKKKRKKHGKVP